MMCCMKLWLHVIKVAVLVLLLIYGPKPHEGATARLSNGRKLIKTTTRTGMTTQGHSPEPPIGPNPKTYIPNPPGHH
ncbi:hypothetical protein COLO4_21545 [Corchorus olitorius]|uniref:Uncharacterized protein n=1 Tax=Corchorus olitorius TaxID=93759 RepID=A0A1R3ISP9_9ROSI|nr:hypothetical protein COLO4_21545 [Corchorus olitorius]